MRCGSNYDTYDSVCDESDAIEADILAIQEAAEASAWTGRHEVRRGSDGQPVRRAGVRAARCAPESEYAGRNRNQQRNGAIHLTPARRRRGISVPLLTKNDLQRTLAVRAALMQQPERQWR